MATVARVFANRYEIRTQIGRGGMADVYLARDRLLNRRVAVKVLSPAFAADPAFVERFRREAQAAASLNHPNIVSVYDSGEEDGVSFIVMEYVNGQTLRELLRRVGPIPPNDAAHIAADIADALEFAHRNGVVHRDVKPGNVLITPEGAVKVTDFGIARAESSDTLTKTGNVLGTATYFSPEQAQGLGLDGRSDVYSLGVVLYEMLTGTPPFIADSPVSVAYKHVREEPVPPSRVKRGIPGALDRIVLTAMAKDVTERYPSAQALRADLLRYERGRPLVGVPATAIASGVAPTLVTADDGGGGAPVAPTPAPAPAAAPRRKRQWGAALSVAVAFGLLVALIVVLLVQSDFGVKSASKPTREVLAVVGQQYDVAAQSLQDQGFAVKRVEEPSDQDANQVLRQDPVEGAKLRDGGTVTLYVSATTVPMPDVIGKSKDDAMAVLQAARIVPVFTETESADQPPGTVLSTSVAAGAPVVKVAPYVGVTISKLPMVAVPDVSNLDVYGALAALQQAGLKGAAQPRNVSSDTVPVGKVVGSDPPAGTQVDPGSEVTVLVSTGPSTRPLPNVVGAQRTDAQNAITALGCSVRVSSQPGPPTSKDVVLTQSPAAGTQLRCDANTFVDITVGS
ncbi:MAG TPA: Stk1 family PASTA domain-containing Ser/Thr kinase [Acidimicrobiia bacterium]|jgi:serine/threonine-protein kinase